jgi:hypothetical protein
LEELCGNVFSFPVELTGCAKLEQGREKEVQDGWLFIGTRVRPLTNCGVAGSIKGKLFIPVAPDLIRDDLVFLEPMDRNWEIGDTF